jgi:hypothetical protein
MLKGRETSYPNLAYIAVYAMINEKIMNAIVYFLSQNISVAMH